MKKTILFLCFSVVSNLFYSQLAPCPTLATSNVTEAAQYAVMYQFDVPNNGNFSNAGQVNSNYSVNQASLNINYNRVAYFVQLVSNNVTKWVWVSMPKFNSTNAELGIPYASSNIIWQQTVSGMNIFGSANSGVTNTLNSTGNLEIWPDCYGTQLGVGGIGGNANTYDFNDTRSANSNCHGSFQIHNYSAQQTLFSYESFMNNAIDGIGIGNNTGNGNPDWTFMANANTYQVKTIYILVNNTASFVINPSTAAVNACQNGTTSSLSVSVAAQGTVTSYQWYANTIQANSGGTLVATNNSSALSNTYTPSTANTGGLYYYCIVNTTSGSGFSNVSGLITTISPPVVSISGTNALCSGQSINLTASGANTYTWSTNSNLSSISVAPTSNITYTLSGTSTAGCVSAAAASLAVTVNPLPTISTPSVCISTRCR